MKLTDFSAIFFDMDGTLVDSESLWRIAEKDTVAHHGANLEPHIQDLFTGIRVDKSAEIMKETYGLNASINELASEIEVRVKVLLKDVKDQAGIPELIETVYSLNLPMALVSNSSREIIEETLKYRPWASYFEHRFAVDDVENPKPAPDLYLLAANKLNVGIQQALVLEDSLTGVKAAVSAGATCVAVPDHIEAAFYDLTPHVFSNLNAFLEHLG